MITIWGDAGIGVLSILASSLRPEGTSVSSSGLDMSVQSWSLSVSGRGKAPGADQARRLTSSTEADWGGRSLGGPGGAGSAALRRSTPVQQARKRRAVTDSFVVCVATKRLSSQPISS